MINDRNVQISRSLPLSHTGRMTWHVHKKNSSQLTDSKYRRRKEDSSSDQTGIKCVNRKRNTHMYLVCTLVFQSSGKKMEFSSYFICRPHSAWILTTPFYPLAISISSRFFFYSLFISSFVFLFATLLCVCVCHSAPLRRRILSNPVLVVVASVAFQSTNKPKPRTSTCMLTKS